MGFPHLVEMQKKFGPDGLVVVTVNIDDASNARVRQAVTRFISDYPTLNHLVLAPGEKLSAWEEALSLGQFPCAFLYNREGKLEQRLEGGDYEPEVLDRKVAEMLKKK
jgi:hypothetical protein